MTTRYTSPTSCKQPTYLTYVYAVMHALFCNFRFRAPAFLDGRLLLSFLRAETQHFYLVQKTIQFSTFTTYIINILIVKVHSDDLGRYHIPIDINCIQAGTWTYVADACQSSLI